MGVMLLVSRMRGVVGVYACPTVEARLIDTWVGYLANAPTVVLGTGAMVRPSVVTGTQGMIHHRTRTAMKTWIRVTHMLMTVRPHVSSGTMTRCQWILHTDSTVMTRVHITDKPLMAICSMIVRVALTAGNSI